jgi:hypothetical protein
MTMLMTVGCLLCVVGMVRVLQGIRSMQGTLYDLKVILGSLCLIVSCFAGAVIAVKRVLVVLGWRRRGHCSFAVGAAGALFVGRKGQAVLAPMDEIEKLEIWIHTVRIKMKPRFARKDELEDVLSEVLQPGGDWPDGRAFFTAFAPLVRKHAPAVIIENTARQSLFR